MGRQKMTALSEIHVEHKYLAFDLCCVDAVHQLPY